MIKSLHLKNFQAHKNRIFNFKDGVNLILGENDSGKSSIIRAIHWVLYNRPSGDWMRRVDGNTLCKTTVKIIFDDDIIIKRIKDDKVNIYEFDGDPFTKVGGFVPTPIQEYLKKTKLTIGSSTFFPNIHMQGEGPFMVSESPITRGALLNYFTGIQYVDKTKRSVSKDLLALSTDMSKNKYQLKEHTSRMKSIWPVASQYDKISSVREKYKKFISYKNLLHSVLHINSDLKSNEKKSVLVKDRVCKLSKLRIKYDELKANQKVLKNFEDLTEKKSKYKSIISCELQIYDLSDKQYLLQKHKEVDKGYGEYKRREHYINLELNLCKRKLKEFDGKICSECGSKIKI